MTNEERRKRLLAARALIIEKAQAMVAAIDGALATADLGDEAVRFALWRTLEGDAGEIMDAPDFLCVNDAGKQMSPGWPS